MKFEGEDQKSLHPKLDGRALSWLPAFGAHFLHGGHNSRLGGYDGILRYGSRLMPTNSGMTTKKKVFVTKSEVCHSVHSCFRLEMKVYLFMLGVEGNKQYFLVGTGPEKHFNDTGPVYIFRLGGTNSD